MKFSLTFEGNAKMILLTPENPGEALLLASLVAENGARVAEKEAEIQFEWTSDRPPYKRCTKMMVVL